MVLRGACAHHFPPPGGAAVNGAEVVGTIVGIALVGILTPALIIGAVCAALRPMGTKPRLGLWRKGRKP